jgi:hypothetical protein
MADLTQLTSARTQRLLLAATVVTGGIFTFGYVLLSGMFPPPSPALSATDVAALYTEHNMRLRIGVALCLIGGGFNIPWSLTVAAQMAKLEKGLPLWSILQMIGAVMNSIMVVVPVLLWGTAAFNPARNPEITQALHDFAMLTFITPVSWLWMQMLPVAIVSLSRRDHEARSAFPRWIGWLSMSLCLITQHGVTGQLVKTGPFAWNGLLTFWVPVAMSGLWVSALYYTLNKSIDASTEARS